MTAKVEPRGEREIVVTREFDAPKHLVYRAYTTPELVQRWWAGRRGEATLVEIDLRVGGRWRYVMVANAGFEVAFHGVYREVVPDERIVNTEVYEAEPDGEALNIATFEEKAGRATLTLVMAMESEEARDTVAAMMEVGLQESLDLLEETVEALAAE